MRDSPSTGGQAAREQPWALRNRTVIFRAAVLGVVAALMAAGVVMWVAGAFDAATLGYPTVWLFSFIGSAAIILPLPTPAGVCIGATPAFGLHPVLLGVISGSAEVLGELVGYAAGATGRSILQRHRWYPRVHNWVQRRGAVVLFAMSVIPNPLFDIVGIAAGSIGYPLRKFIPVVFVSKSIKSTGIAFACYHGIGFIQRLFD
jgi:membrane protein YqaA with SNARE-associated domain